MQEKALGPEHPDVAATKTGLAGAYKSRQRYDEARALLESALAIQEKTLGVNHPALASSLLPLSEIYRALGRRDDAERILRRVRQIRKASLTEVPVLFATNRKRDARAKSIAFGTESENRLTYGTASLTILKDERAERASAQRSQPKKGGNSESITDLKRLSIPLINVEEEAAITSAAKRQLLSSKAYRNQVLIYIHGYNVDFENAVRRAGQIAYDLNFDGPTFVFSWPTRQSWLSYLTDWQTVDVPIEHLRGFLQGVIAPLNASKVHVVAHSMGNVVLLRALNQLMDLDPARRPVVGEIIDAAPDVAPEVFSQFATKIRAGGGNLTVYASAADRALVVSRWLWGRQRVGYIAGGTPELIDGVDLIDITRAGMALFAINHDVYASSPVVVSDMRNILLGERPPDKRTAEFTSVTTKKGKYWVYQGLKDGQP
jgi:esterase/lipase superfamily enzyme